MPMISPTEKETSELQIKKLFPVPDAKLEEMRTRRQAIRNVTDGTFSLIQSSSTRAPLCQLSSLSRKIGRDYEDTYENNTGEADSNKSHSDLQGLVVANSHAELSPPITNTETEAKVKHLEEDKVEFLDAGSQDKVVKKSFSRIWNLFLVLDFPEENDPDSKLCRNLLDPNSLQPSVTPF